MTALGSDLTDPFLTYFPWPTDDDNHLDIHLPEKLIRVTLMTALGSEFVFFSSSILGCQLKRLA